MNQPPPLVDYNPLTADPVLSSALEREGGSWAREEITRFGARVGSAEVIGWGFAANESPPVLRTHDRYGHRIDETEFHPAYHELMELGIGAGLCAGPWSSGREGAHVARAATYRLLHEMESGTSCPITMTFAAVPALRAEPAIAREWEPRILTGKYDPRSQPASGKRGVTIGMAMTEKQGGSDVRAGTTRAVLSGDGTYRLTGHKWFCSAPMSDAFLVLAQAPGGLTCFLLPRWTPDGERNAFYIQRLKDKLGNRSNASSEVEFEGAWAQRLGPEGRGVPTIIEMVHHTRFDCVIGSSALMRQAVTQAVHHARHRQAFGRQLIEQPLMRATLADLCVESEAATLLMMRLARAFDGRAGVSEDGRAGVSEDGRAAVSEGGRAGVSAGGEHAFARIATAVSKYWVCKRASVVAAEALECLGGAGYVEESILPRIYREAPLNSIWEGSGNVNCLDVLRAMQKEPDALPALRAELALARGKDARYDAYIERLERELVASPDESQVRGIVERLALALQGSLVLRHSPKPVADAFCASRLAGEWGRCFGTLPRGVDLGAIVERALAR